MSEENGIMQNKIMNTNSNALRKYGPYFLPVPNQRWLRLGIFSDLISQIPGLLVEGKYKMSNPGIFGIKRFSSSFQKSQAMLGSRSEPSVAITPRQSVAITPRQGVAITPRQGVAITPSSRNWIGNDFYNTKFSKLDRE